MENSPVSPLQDLQAKGHFELEEYKQVLRERQFVMKSYMQAVGLYLALSGFALKELLDARSAYRTWILAGAFTLANVLALFAANRFKGMAEHAMNRERFFVERYSLEQTSVLFWGYHLGVILVAIDQVAVITIALMKAMLSPTALI